MTRHQRQSRGGWPGQVLPLPCGVAGVQDPTIQTCICLKGVWPASEEMAALPEVSGVPTSGCAKVYSVPSDQSGRWLRRLRWQPMDIPIRPAENGRYFSRESDGV